MDSQQTLKGKVALVTGGAGGLGEATSRVLAEAGTTVVVADLRLDEAEALAAGIEGAGQRALPLKLDVSADTSVQAAIRETVERCGRLDVLVNNAGVDVTAPIEELTPGDWERVCGVNLTGAFLTARAAFPVMRGQGGGHIVNIISTAAKRTWANASVYHASKWGLLGLSHALHVEGRPAGIKVTAVISGGMRTPFLLDRFPDIDPGCLQDPRTVAETIRFVLSQPAESVIPEVMVLPMRETSWP